MERVLRIPPDLIDFALTISAEDRLRQAEDGFRLYLTVHKPYASPWTRGFDRLEDYWKFEKEDALPR